MAKKDKVPAPTSTAAEELSTNAGGGNVVVALNRAQGIVFTMNDGRKVEIAGNSVHLKGKEMGILPLGAFGLTVVAEKDWKEIEAQIKGTALYKSGRIFCQKKKDAAVAEAKETEETRHGLEPVDGHQTAAADV